MGRGDGVIRRRRVAIAAAALAASIALVPALPASADAVRDAHTLKGNAAMLGAMALSQAARALEKALEQGAAEAPAAYAALQAEAQRLLASLEEIDAP